MSIQILRTVNELRQAIDSCRSGGRAVALVPTMGGIHEGHLALIREGRRYADVVIPTIFVNPKQFSATEDLKHYPRNEEKDIATFAETDIGYVYAPDVAEMYPPGSSTIVRVEGPAKAGLEDKFRPHFFDGVATIVAKLFVQSGADYAMFGEKDYQQLIVVKTMARDLDIPTEVIGVSTVREDDGLAMSTRNRYLSKHERRQATAIIRTLEQAAEKIRNGIEQQTATKAAARSLNTLGFKVDYVSARNAETLAVPVKRTEPLRLLAAAWLGTTRLIDNIAI